MKRLAGALEAAKSTRSRIAKERALGDALASIGADPGSDLALATATRIASGRPLAVGDERSLGAGYSLWFDVAASLPGFSPAELRDDARRTGDLGDAIALLAGREAGAADRAGLALEEVAALFDALASTGQRAEKKRLLLAAAARATPLELKYLVKAMLGEMRTGMVEGAIQGAIARAFPAPLEDVRRAMALVADAGETAVLARHGRLAEARVAFGRPVAFMLATPIETLAAEVDRNLFALEEKIDGVRAQAHKAGGEVALFARGLSRVTQAFPEVVRALEGAPGDVILDGEIVAMTDGRPRPFQSLQPRLKKLVPTREQLDLTPVTMVVYDLLADGGGVAVDLPWTERRARLEAFVASVPESPALRLHPRRPGSEMEIDAAFTLARAGGFEGLVLKRTDSRYEAGKRGQAWLKVKRAYATLDVVVTVAEEGHGKRAGVLSDYTFAVWRGDDLVNVGKAYSGLTDDEILEMTRRLTELTLSQAGGVRRVRPEIVLEVAFDGVQPSDRHDSGYALRFPRIVRVRDDKAPADADRLETVKALFDTQVAEGHREALAPGASAPKRKRGKKATESRQLDLFSPAQPAPEGPEAGDDG